MKSVYRIIVFILSISVYDTVSAQFNPIDKISGSTGINPQNLFRFGSLLYFSADTGATDGRELWKSDGTLGGTVRVADIRPGSGASNPREFTLFRGALYFIAENSIGVGQVFRLDGSGNPEVVDGGFFPSELKVAGSGITETLYFAAQDFGTFGRELYKNTGTGSSIQVEDINSMSGNSSPLNLTSVNDTIYFSANNGVANNGRELWKSYFNGAIDVTTMVKDINPGIGDSNPQQLLKFNDSLYFSADDGTNGTELWKSNGITTNTLMIKDINPTGGSNPLELIKFNDSLYFSANDGTNGQELWKSRGTSLNTVMVKDINTIPSFGSTPSYLTIVNGVLYFSAFSLTGNGTELWKADITDGAVLVKDINVGGESSPTDLKNVNNILYFAANDGSTGKELWQSQGTDLTTSLRQNIEPGSGNSNPTSITPVGSRTFLVATTTLHGTELWVENAVALPLISLEFMGRLVQNDGLLEWKTKGETNTSEFIIERSMDGRSYKAIGTVAAAGNSTVGSNYQFSDKNITFLGASVIYYRLLQRDIDGRFTYSRIIVLPINSKSPIVKLYPNPVKDEASLIISVVQDEKLIWQIIDNSGKILQQTSQQLSAGSTNINVNVKGLVRGVYYLRVQGSSIDQQIQFVKQ